MNIENDESDNRHDEAMKRRLGRLQSMPVDAHRLDAVLGAAIPRPRRQRLGWLRPFRAVAAGFVILLLTAGILLSTSGGGALASTAQMAQMHQDLVSGRTPVTRVDSIDAANKLLASESRQCPEVPDVPKEHVMACCMKSVKNRKVACVLLKSEGVPVTMVVANASDMRSPKSAQIVRSGITYNVESVGPLNMVMTERNERWVCLIGEMPAEQLMDLAAKLEF
jgi:hypothetical protein